MYILPVVIDRIFLVANTLTCRRHEIFSGIVIDESYSFRISIDEFK